MSINKYKDPVLDTLLTCQNWVMVSMHVKNAVKIQS